METQNFLSNKVNVNNLSHYQMCKNYTECSTPTISSRNNMNAISASKCTQNFSFPTIHSSRKTTSHSLINPSSSENIMSSSRNCASKEILPIVPSSRKSVTYSRITNITSVGNISENCGMGIIPNLDKFDKTPYQKGGVWYAEPGENNGNCVVQSNLFKPIDLNLIEKLENLESMEVKNEFDVSEYVI